MICALYIEIENKTVRLWKRYGKKIRGKIEGVLFDS